MNAYGAYLNYWIERNGRIVFSSVQPEMRTAILKLQEMYAEGLINRDFAALNDLAARELVASGLVGAQYASAWSVTGGMNTLVQNNPQYLTSPERMIRRVFPPPAVRGQTVQIQVNGPIGYRVFVSNQTAYPEAALKIATYSYHLGHSGQ